MKFFTAIELKKAVERLFKRQSERGGLGIDADLHTQDIRSQWGNIRKAYRFETPEIMEELKSGKYCPPEFMDFRRVMSPIEKTTWDDIRSYGVRLFPQFPVLHYFIDFANPLYKIGLEVDGAQWHDEEKDRARDARLAKEGWKIYRVKGRYVYDEFYMSIVLAAIARMTNSIEWCPVHPKMEALLEADHQPEEIDAALYEGAYEDYQTARNKESLPMNYRPVSETLKEFSDYR